MAAAKCTQPRPLSAVDISRMKPGDELADTSESRGLRVTRAQGDHRFWYQYKAPVTGKQKALHIGYGAYMNLAEARVEFARLKSQRRAGRPAGVAAHVGIQPEPAAGAQTHIRNRLLQGPVLVRILSARYKKHRFSGCQVHRHGLPICVAHMGCDGCGMNVYHVPSF